MTTTAAVAPPPRMRVSASRLTTWQTCPLQARFQYIDHLPRQTNAYAAFGSCVHHCLAHYNTTGDIESTLKLFVDIWNKPEKIGIAIEVWPRGINYGGSRDRGLDMLRLYHEKQEWEPRDVIAIEHRFLVPFGSFEIQGAVDLIEVKKSGRGKNTLRVVDYKTNRKTPFRDALALNVQFTLYDWAVRQREFWVGAKDPTTGEPLADFPEVPGGEWQWELLKDMPKRGIWYQLETQKELDVGVREDIDYRRAYRVCQMIERAEKFNVFVPNISGDTCTFCPYTKPCGLPVDRLDDPEEEDSDAWL